MKKLMLVCVLCLCVAGVANAAITRVYAVGGVGGNTVNVATGSETDWFVVGGNLMTDNLWGERDGLGEDAAGQIYEGWGPVGLGTETLPQLKTTITGLTAGESYYVWANYIRLGYNETTDPDGNRGAITAGLSLGTLYTFDADTGEHTVIGGSEMSGFTVADKRAGIRGFLGTAVVDAGGEISLYVDGYVNSGQERTWYDGASFEMIPEPTTMALLALGSLGLIKRRK